jgi:hypothetical protein
MKPSGTEAKGDRSMKHLLAVSIFAVGLMLCATSLPSQDHSNGSPSMLRGTYTFAGNAWQDLSVINPALPKGYAPVSLIGSFIVNDHGDVTGWALVNAGGIPFRAEFVNSRFGALKTDGSFSLSLSMKINEFGGIIDGPYTYTGVIGGEGSAMEISIMMHGAGPGSHLEWSHAKRISMNYD